MSIDTTTGMSPPPIAATMWNPRANASAAITRINAQPSPDGVLPTTTNHTMSTKNTTNAPRLSMLRPGSVSGADFIFADSLR